MPKSDFEKLQDAIDECLCAFWDVCPQFVVDMACVYLVVATFCAVASHW